MSITDHHDLALMLLVGRALPTGLPWPLDEDQRLVRRERELWAKLTPDEQTAEQAFLAALWGHRGRKRVAPINPAWGPWAANLGPEIAVPDAAFGLPEHGFRPWLRGSWEQEHTETAQVLRWLWTRGFQVAGVDRDIVTLVIPAGRLIQESERLTTLVRATYGPVRLGPWGTGAQVWIRSLFDPVSGQATIELRGLT